ncbi:MAG TPA: sigma 54-interacting transcriptional regulator [Vicinamibacterales bacterium]|nr:sigma 54-interacting transcriptional regulator [Vicinamibacterales bacterium]
MTRLLHDRYYAYAADLAWDLATGESVAIGELATTPAASTPAPGAEPLIEMLDHGRDREPRWVVVETAAGQSALAIARRVAEQGRVRGFVPIAVGVYLRLRSLLEEELRHRTLMLILRPGSPLPPAREAIVSAAAVSPRPHVLVSFRSTRGPARSSHQVTCNRGAVGDNPGGAVREARARYGSALASRRIREVLPEDVLRHMTRGSRWVDLCRSGRHAAAERLLRDVAGALVRRSALVPAVTTLVTLGRLVLERGRAGDADAIFGEAASHAHDAGDESLAGTARIWQAAARTDAAQLTAGESLCRAAIVAGTLTGGERARADATLARILIWQGRVAEAVAGDPPGDVDDGELVAFVGATSIRVLIARGDLFAAGQRARDLLVRAATSGDALVRVMALTAHLRVLIECGDLALAEQALVDVRDAARAARTPLRMVRARLLWVDGLRRAGRMREADRELRDLRRLRGVTPPLLRAAIDGRLRDELRRPQRVQAPGSGHGAAATMVVMARDEEQDREAVRKVLAFVSASLQTSRIDLCSADAGPDTTVMSVGSGLSTALGSRVLDAGIVIDTCTVGEGGELGVPVRVGSRLLAAIIARWPIDRPSPAHARELLELAAAVAAPRIDTMRVTAREAASASIAVPELVGSSEAIAEVRRAVTRAAAAPFSVLIEGESGSGKELVARALHQLSPRRERRFCDVNCAALPDDLLESELFGHMRGAFTGAVTDRAGLIEEADGGTLFLDEVADLSPRAQAKLLRVLQQQEVRRVGATFSRKVDVRVVSAANRDMRREVADGRFRQDLLYRLDVIRIRVPALRERPEDIPVLAHHIWEAAAARVGSHATLTHSVLSSLSRYHWPGNVRELQNVMAGLAVSAPARGQIKASLLPPIVAGAAGPSATRLADARDQFERRFIELALARAGGRRARAARELGLSRQGLLKMMARLGVEARPTGSRRGSSSPR